MTPVVALQPLWFFQMFHLRFTDNCVSLTLLGKRRGTASAVVCWPGEWAHEIMVSTFGAIVIDGV